MYLNKHALFDWCSCRMGLPVDELDRDDHTHEKQEEGEEIQTEIRICTPPPIGKKKKRKYKKRYFTVCLFP